SLEQTFRGFGCLLHIRHPSLKLLFVHRSQNLADARARVHAEREQMTPEQNRRRRTMLDAERASALQKPVHCLAVECTRLAPKTICLREPREQLEVDLLRESPKRAVADFVTHLEPHAWLEVL